MPAEHRPRSTFDEHAALTELERLQRGIEESRRQRKDAVARFDAFVRSFQNPGSASERVDGGQGLPAGRHAADRPEPARAATGAMLTRGVSRAPSNLPPRDPPPVAPVPAAVIPQAVPAPPAIASTPPEKSAAPGTSMDAFPAERPAVPEPFVVPEAVSGAPEARPARRVRVVPIAAVAVLAIVAVVLLMRPWRSTAPQAQPSTLPAALTTPATTAEPPADPAVQPAPVPSAQPVPVAGDESGIRGELTTLRTAWVRVTLDGDRAIERELPADARIPLRAERTIAVRVGDAGAVRLTIDGRDQGVLGGDGQVVTRTFTARPRPPR